MPLPDQKKFGPLVSEEITETFRQIFPYRTYDYDFYGGTSEETWEPAKSVQKTFSVPAGTTVAIWQYIYNCKFAQEAILFRSSIIETTDDVKYPPRDHIELRK